MTTTSCHPQRRRLNQPRPDKNNVTASNRNARPTVFPKGVSSLYACGLSVHTRSRTVPGHAKVIPATHAMVVPKNKKTPIAVIPRGEGAFGGIGEAAIRENYTGIPFSEFPKRSEPN